MPPTTIFFHSEHVAVEDSMDEEEARMEQLREELAAGLWEEPDWVEWEEMQTMINKDDDSTIFGSME